MWLGKRDPCHHTNSHKTSHFANTPSGEISLSSHYQTVSPVSSFNPDWSSRLHSQMSSYLSSILRWSWNLKLKLCRTTLTLSPSPVLQSTPANLPLLNLLIPLNGSTNLCHSKRSLRIIKVNLQHKFMLLHSLFYKQENELQKGKTICRNLSAELG